MDLLRWSFAAVRGLRMTLHAAPAQDHGRN
jgi:hypothetical protein